MMELKLTNTSPTVRIKETDRKVIKIVKVVVKAAANCSAFDLEVMDEKELCFYSKKIDKDITSNTEYELIINKQFQVNNHLSVSISPSDNADFEAMVFID